MVKIDDLVTETRNQRTMNLGEMTALEIAQVMNEEDEKVAQAIKPIVPQIAEAITLVANSIQGVGRLIYMGAGTSGRLGVLDAVECVPTFGVSFEKVIGLIAGGEGAFVRAVEGAEDSETLGVEDLQNINLTAEDVVIGIAASGRTPYVIAGLRYARTLGAATIAVSCNKNSLIGKEADIALEVEVGPEVLAGSTRLRSGTAQKMILNMISTGAMVRIGKVYKNLMVDVQQTNVKLEERGKNIVMEATGADRERVTQSLQAADNDVKIAIVMILANTTKEDAHNRLQRAKGFVAEAIK